MVIDEMMIFILVNNRHRHHLSMLYHKQISLNYDNVIENKKEAMPNMAIINQEHMKKIKEKEDNNKI